MVTSTRTSTADSPAAGTAPRGVLGGVTLEAERIGGRTRLTSAISRAPLQVLRAHYLDATLPDMAFVTLANASGGVLQGDRLELNARVGAGARLRIDTPSATRLYRAPASRARAVTRLCVADGGYLEYLPDPLVPFAGSDFATETVGAVAANGLLVLSEVVGSGRAARGERHQFARFEARTTLLDDGGRTLAVDGLLLDPADDFAAAGVLGRFAAIGTLIVAARGFEPALLRETSEALATGTGAQVGASSLPNGAGAWLKVLAPTTSGAVAVIAAAAAAARRHLVGAPPPASRRP